jgi:hypothetical protein
LPVKRFFNARLEGAISVWFTPARDRSFDVRQHVEAVRDRLHFQRLTQGARLGQAMRFAPTCGRSGGAGEAGAGAVRGRASSTPRPDAKAMAGASIRTLGLAFRLTPARCDASKLVATFGGPDGSGVAVAGATHLQPWCNSQSIDFAALSVAVARLQAGASRHVRAYVRVGARVSGGFGKPATLQPSELIHMDHKVSGCRAVAARLRLQPASDRAADRACAVVQANILAAGYRRGSLDGRSSGVKRGRVGETFGDFRPGADRAGWRSASSSAGSVRISARCENGGFLRVCAGRSGLVGKPMLEGCTQSLGFAWFSDQQRKPSGLLVGPSSSPWSTRSAGGGIDRPAAPPSPPSCARPSPCTLAHAVCQIWTGYPALIHSGALRGLAGARQSGRLRIGSGCGLGVRQPAKRVLGRGAGLAGMPRRFCDGSAGVIRVN